MNNWKIFIIAAMTIVFVSCNNSEKTDATETTEEAVAEGTNAESTEPTEMEASVIYTCPMHPEVQQDKPGKCPKCEMDLVVKK